MTTDSPTPLRSRLVAGLYFLATPIGAARDITLRALDILASADVLAAEDTRTLRHLMEIHGVPLGDRPLVACHDHNEEGVSAKLLRAVAAALGRGLRALRGDREARLPAPARAPGPADGRVGRARLRQGARPRQLGG